jgi:hypothetical protein
MYFVNKHKFVVRAPFIDKANVCGVEVYQNPEDIEKVYPELNSSEIPTIKPSKNDENTFLMVTSNFGVEAFSLAFNEDVEDWIENQTDSYHIEDGYSF